MLSSPSRAISPQSSRESAQHDRHAQHGKHTQSTLGHGLHDVDRGALAAGLLGGAVGLGCGGHGSCGCGVHLLFVAEELAVFGAVVAEAVGQVAKGLLLCEAVDAAVLVVLGDLGWAAAFVHDVGVVSGVGDGAGGIFDGDVPASAAGAGGDGSRGGGSGAHCDSSFGGMWKSGGVDRSRIWWKRDM